MLGSGKSKRPDSKLLANLISSQNKLAATLHQTRTISEANGLATSAWTTPDGPIAMQKTAVLTRALATTATALDNYTISVNNFTQDLQALVVKEAAVAEVTRDRDILIERLVKVTKRKAKPNQEDKHLETVANTQQELAACETVLAAEQDSLSETREQTLTEHARARLLALHLFGIQAQQAAAEGLQHLDALIGYAPEIYQASVQQATIPQSQAEAPPSIVQNYLADQDNQVGSGVPGQLYHGYGSPSLAQSTSVYDAAPSYSSVPDHQAYPRDAVVPSVAPVQEGNELESVSRFDPGSQPEGYYSTEQGPPTAHVPGEFEPNQQGLQEQEQYPTRQYSTHPSPYQAAEVGVVVTPGVTSAPTNGYGRPSQLIASSRPVPTGPTYGSENASLNNDVFVTPTAEVTQGELENNYSSDDPDDHAIQHRGPYASGRPTNTTYQPVSRHLSTMSKPTTTTARGTRHRKHASEPDARYVHVGPDGAIDHVGTAVDPSEAHRYQDTYHHHEGDSSGSEEPSKLSRHLSLGSKKEKNSKHTSSDKSHNILSRLNNVLLTDITAAAAEAQGNHETSDDKESNRRTSLRRSHSSSSNKHQRDTQRSSSTRNVGRSVLPVEEEEDSADELNPVHSSGSGWKTRTDRNIRDLGSTIPDDGGLARTNKVDSQSKLSSKPSESKVIPPEPLETKYANRSEPEDRPVWSNAEPRTPTQTTQANDDLSSPVSSEPKTPSVAVAKRSSPVVVNGTGVEQDLSQGLTTDSNLQKKSYDTTSVPPTGLGTPFTSTIPEPRDVQPQPQQTNVSTDGTPVRVKKVVKVRKVRKPSSQRPIKSTGTGTGHTYETLRQTPTRSSRNNGGSGGSIGTGLYQVSAPASTLDSPHPYVPKAPPASGYATRTPRTSRFRGSYLNRSDSD